MAAPSLVPPIRIGVRDALWSRPKVKLKHVTYENVRRVQEQTLAELGGNRAS